MPDGSRSAEVPQKTSADLSARVVAGATTDADRSTGEGK
jgi:hypothetical protein